MKAKTARLTAGRYSRFPIQAASPREGWYANRVQRALPFFVLVSCAALTPTPTPTKDAAPALRLGADAHVHLTMSHAANPLFAGEPGDGQLATSASSRLVNQVDERQLKDSGVRLLFGALWAPPSLRPGRTPFTETLHQIEQLEAFSARRPGFAVVHDVTEAKAALSGGRIAVFPQVEGGEAITRVEDVDLLYAAGVRCITLVHFVTNSMAGAAHGQLSTALLGMRSEALEPQGLTELGKQAVARMMQLGIVIDVSHSSDQTIEDVLALTEPLGVPVIASHTGSRALVPFERNLSDALAQRIVRGGGLIGVTLFNAQLETPAEQQLPAHVRGTCDDVLAHWLHFKGLVGEQGLVLGSDFNGYTVRPAAGHRCPNGLRNTGDFNTLWSALSEGGLSRDSLDTMGERLLSLVGAVEQKADVTAQASAKQKARTLARLPRDAALEVP